MNLHRTSMTVKPWTSAVFPFHIVCSYIHSSLIIQAFPLWFTGEATDGSHLDCTIVLQSSCPFLIIPARTLKARDKVLLCLHFGMSVYPCFGFSFWMTNIDSCRYTPNSSHAGTERTCLFVIWAVFKFCHHLFFEVSLACSCLIHYTTPPHLQVQLWPICGSVPYESHGWDCFCFVVVPVILTWACLDPLFSVWLTAVKSSGVFKWVHLSGSLQ